MRTHEEGKDKGGANGGGEGRREVGGEGSVARAAVPPARRGPGTHLAGLLRELQLEPDECECRERMEEMDRWGLEGCLRRRVEIEGWLEEAAETRGWGEYFRAAWEAFGMGLGWSLNPLNPAPGLVREALRRAGEDLRADGK